MALLLLSCLLPSFAVAALGQVRMLIFLDSMQKNALQSPNEDTAGKSAGFDQVAQYEMKDCSHINV